MVAVFFCEGWFAGSLLLPMLSALDLGATTFLTTAAGSGLVLAGVAALTTGLALGAAITFLGSALGAT